jgi:hypothetical protein
MASEADTCRTLILPKLYEAGWPDKPFAGRRPFPLHPSHAGQTRIVAEVERRSGVVEELESVVSANLQRATRLRQSILHKAFTGGLTL